MGNIINTKPPKFAEWLLTKLGSGVEEDSLAGDLFEEFCSVTEKRGYRSAKHWYRLQVLKAAMPFVFYTIYWSMTMLKSYIKIAFRNLRKSKAYSFITIAGLSVSMACCIIILLWVSDELSWDRFHENSDNICIVLKGSEDSGTFSYTNPGPLAAVLKDRFPEIVNSTRLYPLGSNTLKSGGESINFNGSVTDPSFFKIFSFPFIKGEPENVFPGPETVVLTESTAKKLFGETDPVGKAVKFEWWGRWIDLNITGVIKDIPDNSHIKYDFFLPFFYLKKTGWNVDKWTDSSYPSYVQLHKNSSLKSVENKISGIIKEYLPVSDSTVHLQKMTRIHLYNYSGGGAITYVYIFSVTGIIILVIACINFINISTARSVKRAKEVGIRKTAGSTRAQLIWQFLSESFLLTFISMIAAVCSVILILPSINNLLGSSLALRFAGADIFYLFIIALITGILSGSYPALYFSGFQPNKLLRGQSKSNFSKQFLRKTLVLIQFVFSVVFIICAVISSEQLSYIKNKDLGFNKNNVIRLKLRGEFFSSFDIIKNELLQDKNIMAMTSANSPFTSYGNSTTGKYRQGNEDRTVGVRINAVDYDYLKTFEMKMKSGRFFSKEFTADAKKSVILNETAVKAIELKQPLGEIFECVVGREKRQMKIIGVIKDFNFHSLHKEVKPMCLVIAPWWHKSVYIKIRPQNIPAAISFINRTIQNSVPDYPFEYSFLDEGINRLYNTERSAGILIRYGTFFAIFISFLGLFGLASYSAEQRTKEICIRKVLGSSFSKIILLMTKESVFLILIANAVSWPAAYLIMNKWLQNFAFRTDISITIFIFTCVLTLLITVFTVCFQAIKAARTNPVDALKFE